jgi:hypothetical protein
MELVAREKFCVIFWSDLTFSAQGLVFSQQCSWKLGICCCVIGWMSFPLDFLTLKMFLQNGRNRSPRDTSACPRSPRYACFFDCMICHFVMCCVLVFDNFRHHYTSSFYQVLCWWMLWSGFYFECTARQTVFCNVSLPVYKVYFPYDGGGCHWNMSEYRVIL